jgi:hypothetical protein
VSAIKEHPGHREVAKNTGSSTDSMSISSDESFGDQVATGSSGMSSVGSVSPMGKHSATPPGKETKSRSVSFGAGIVRAASFGRRKGRNAK